MKSNITVERACGPVQHADILPVEEEWRWCTVDRGIVIYLYYRLLNLLNKKINKLIHNFHFLYPYLRVIILVPFEMSYLPNG